MAEVAEAEIAGCLRAPGTTARPSGWLPGVALRLLGDDRLARLAAKGEAQAFAVIYERYHGDLYRYCRSIVRHHEDACDALQSTMLNAFRALAAAGPTREIALKPWLYRIAHNESISLMRRRRRHEPLGEQSGGTGPGPEDDGSRERLAQLVADLRELSDQQRGTLIMRELNGLEYGEIADAFGISAAAAKQSVFEARMALHELAEGRDTECEAIRRSISNGDRRAFRGRRVRGHLRDCAGCRDFADSLDVRRSDFAILAPVFPGGVATAILAGVLGAGTTATGGGAVVFGLTASAAKIVGGSSTTKAFVAGVMALAAGTGTAGTIALDVATRARGAGGGDGAAARQAATGPAGASAGLAASPGLSPASEAPAAAGEGGQAQTEVVEPERDGKPGRRRGRRRGLDEGLDEVDLPGRGRRPFRGQRQGGPPHTGPPRPLGQPRFHRQGPPPTPPGQPGRPGPAGPEGGRTAPPRGEPGGSRRGPQDAGRRRVPPPEGARPAPTPGGGDRRPQGPGPSPGQAPTGDPDRQGGPAPRGGGPGGPPAEHSPSAHPQPRPPRQGPDGPRPPDGHRS